MQCSNESPEKIDAKETDYLYVKKSQIPNAGNGLYTALPIYENEIISIFKGEILQDKEAEKWCRCLFYKHVGWNHYGFYECKMFCQICK